MKTVENTTSKYNGSHRQAKRSHHSVLKPVADDNSNHFSDSFESGIKPKSGFKKAIGVIALAASVIGGAYAFTKYENFKKELTNATTEQQIATQLDHQGIVFNSVDVSGKQVITNIPVSATSKNSFAFYTDILPTGQVELYQNLSTASGETRHIYPIVDVRSEHMAQKALQAVMSQVSK